MRLQTLMLPLLALVMLLVPATGQANPAASKVFLNGVPTPVFFNDGDSFRVLAGPLYGTNARLAGFNTLESYGPTHEWGSWHQKELYVISKMATLNARRGVWHCTSDLRKDTYGRILWDCPDLARDQIRKGLAHALSINQDPANAEYLQIQQDAMSRKVGMWAKGTPDFVVTSLHSAAEAQEGNKPHYNRVVSTKDGHSLRWEHREVYNECDKVCVMEYAVKPDQVSSVAAALKQDATAGAAVKSLTDEQLNALVTLFARYDKVDGLPDYDAFLKVQSFLRAQRASGAISSDKVGEVTCMTYIDFTRRFGGAKAACLK